MNILALVTNVVIPGVFRGRDLFLWSGQTVGVNWVKVAKWI